MKKEFIDTREGRVIKIITEFLESKNKLEKLNINNTITIFGSARTLSEKEALDNLKKAQEENKDIKKAERDLKVSMYYEKACDLAFKLANWSKKFEEKDKFYICTGAGGGIMEAGNKGAYLAKEKSIGLNIDLPFEQYYNKYLKDDDVLTFQYFFLRKFWFTYLAKALIAFPGGFGTLDEVFENLTLIQTHKVIKKLPFVLFGKDFFSSFVDTEKLYDYSFISKDDKDLIFLTDDVNEAFEYITMQLEDNLKAND